MEGGVITVKEETEVITSSSSSSTASSSAPSSAPRAMERLHGSGPAPFLRKIYEMVEDPSTDPVVSWSRARNSFVVWDSHNFSNTLLPKYFKHSNFSSFIRQLNTYGFRKVDPDRYEFANEGFLGGQKHLLNTIKRRRNIPQSIYQQGGGGASEGACVELGHYGIEEEVERLKRDRNTLMEEIERLRQSQQTSRDRVIAMEDQIRVNEKKQQQLMSFLAKMFSNPSFAKQYIDKCSKKKEQKRIEIGRKRRLTMSPNVENLEEEVIPAITDDYESQELQGLGDISNGLGTETLFAIGLDNELIGDLEGPKMETNSSIGASLDPLNESIWEELLGGDSIAGNEEEDDEEVVVVVDDEEEDVEVEDLAPKALDWTEDIEGLVGQMGFLDSDP